MKILVIDDDPSVRKFIATTLKNENYTVTEAENGEDGLKKFQEERDIGIIITDLLMPDKEGIETIMEIRKVNPSIKILAISGGGKAGPENYLLLADAVGANATLKKPFSGQELIMCLRLLE
ncbi:response regulator receiver protein [Chlorobaculum parvum NCIB 8327]|uniref:Response regulator receiver protein n=1 Tax=Chlorobaculum parvum (strain DSM 263 / NCIMB 8327) TaxID=517417 RepID=B3QL89_CHLP8|nr:response regulator [Chlorobaculum parvum]ACF12327.1 response regulator receiver protein [Chlorobaculum parvum NCIB 8327]